MLIKECEEVTKQGFCKILWRKLPPGEFSYLYLFNFNFKLILTQVGGVAVGTYLSLIEGEEVVEVGVGA